MPATEGFLRQRKPQAPPDADAPAMTTDLSAEERKDVGEVVWGKTPGGEVFRVPTTHDVLTTLFHPGYRKSHLDLLNLGLLAYDGGLGWVLTKQSKKKWIVREVQRLGWLDEKRHPKVRAWIRRELADKMGGDYSFDELPAEYNAWLLFRQAVDVILVNDFLSYCMFAFSCFRVPEDLSTAVHIMRWLGGIALIGFNLWVKTEAHNVVKDYGWYWGDCFFQRGALVFDGVFELAPHPMYSVGYAGYYGLSLIVGSYAVLFVSLAGHAAQFAFLILFENPHIERMYGQRKAIGKRTPLVTAKRSSGSTSTQNVTPEASTSRAPTPGITEADTATETELETEIEDVVAPKPSAFQKRAKTRHAPTLSADSAVADGDASPQRRAVVSQHDLFNKYFRRDAVVLRNVDLLRATDAMLVLIVFYGLAFVFLPAFSQKTALVVHFAHALVWCMIHYFGLGLLLRAQGDHKFLVRHYLKNYHYDYAQSDRGQNAVIEAFANWKTLFNLSMCMTYVSVIGVAWKAYSLPNNWTVGNELLRHTLGLILIALHVWATMESYEVLGVFGWFFGDFFMEEFPAHLEYTGIYRYLNNPEAMGGAAYFGLALISGSKLVLALAVLRHLANWWFLSSVEHPHMRKLYGDSLRKDAGFVKVMKGVASRNARLLESRAARHAPELKRVAREVIGTFDKVYEETADAVEDFLARSAPRISEVVQDTKVLLRQSREKLVITRVANDIASYDKSQYRVSVVPSPTTARLAYHLGEKITVKWQAPHGHSRKDWIGLYRVGANKSRQVTKTSSMGMWLPVHGEEWDGDVPLGMERGPSAHYDMEKGTITFGGNTLPWLVGRYEVRYHHDGKYNVMSMDGPLEIYVDRPSEVTFATVRESLMQIVPLCLDSDPSLIPLSCKPSLSEGTSGSGGGAHTAAAPLEGEIADTQLDATASASGAGAPETDQEQRDPDDFSFWSERQAKRICAAVKQIFDVEYAAEVVVADANLTALANRILVSKEILASGV